jgi:hypothetical protein
MNSTTSDLGYPCEGSAGVSTLYNFSICYSTRSGRFKKHFRVSRLSRSLDDLKGGPALICLIPAGIIIIIKYEC